MNGDERVAAPNIPVKDGRVAPKGLLIASRVNFDASVHMPVARELAKLYNTKVVVVVSKKRTADQWLKWLDNKVEPLLIEPPRSIAKLDAAEVFRKAAVIEREYACSYLRDILHQDKSIAAHFLQHAPFAPQAARPTADYISLVHYINGLFDVLPGVFERNEIDLCLTRASGLVNSVALIIANRRGSALSWLNHTREGNRLQWMDGVYHASGMLRAVMDFNSAQETGFDVQKALEPPPDTVSARRRAGGHGSYSRLCRQLYAIARGRLLDRAYDLLHRSWPGRQTWLAQTRNALCEFRAARTLLRLSQRKPGGGEDRPFVLFLLHLDPEYTSSTLCKQFNHIHAIIQQVALSLPVGWDLVVKEHVVGIGNRAPSFYTDLAHLPNLRFAPHTIPATQLLAQARGAATAWGTICIEAALMGKPVVTFACFNEYEVLPNIFACPEPTAIPDVLREAFADRSEQEVATWIEKAQRFKSAQRYLSFELPSLALDEFGNKNRFDDSGMAADLLSNATGKLIDVYEFQRNQAKK